MEIRDPIHGSIEFNPKEVAVLESTPFQRLRNIKQLGFGEFSFPGATHNRFLHSVGVAHLAGECFDSIFRGYSFEKEATRWRLRQTVRLAALLHDVGHGPLSHTSEEVMPQLEELKIEAYKFSTHNLNRQATHEDYSIKIITDSELAQVIKNEFSDIKPIHVAALIDKKLELKDDFFIDKGVSFRKLLSQLVSSELDVDRMDYLLRDSHFCGTNYGRVELEWLIDNMSYLNVEGSLHLALGRRALYTFDDFLISRHHMYLMVYFHHKSIIYDEMLLEYLKSEDCSFHLPADIDNYIQYNDALLFDHLKKSDNPWAQRISNKKPYKMLIEFHETKTGSPINKVKQLLNDNNIHFIHSNSIARLSKYHPSKPEKDSSGIFVVDLHNRIEKPYPIEETTEIFERYETSRLIERLYVAPEKHLEAKKLLQEIRK